MAGSGIQKQSSLLGDADESIPVQYTFRKMEIIPYYWHRLCWTMEGLAIISSITDNNDDLKNSTNNLQKYYPQCRLP